MAERSDYVLATGEEAAYRLEVLNRVHGPDSETFLLRAGLTSGMRVADIGCGAGIMAAWMADVIGPDGEVWCIDASEEQIMEARRRARPNMRFRVASAEETSLPPGSFDLVYSRFVLMHLTNPRAALREMRALLKPGGILAVEDGDFTTPFCWPPCAAFDRAFELYRAIGVLRGQDFLIGRKLYAMVLAAGFTDAQAELAQPAFTRGDQKRLPEWTLTETGPALIEAGLTTEAEIARLAAELERHAADESTLIGMARMMQVRALRP